MFEKLSDLVEATLELDRKVGVTLGYSGPDLSHHGGQALLVHAQDVRVGHLDGVDLQVHVAGQQLVDHRLESVLKVLLADLVAKL
jgi:hypothetical protein